MELKGELFKELVKNGYSERKNGEKVWSVAKRCLLYMSDELADSFLKLRDHPRYKTTIVDIEMKLLAKTIEGYKKHIGEQPINLIDMGCGDGKKARTFIENLNGAGKIRFCPVNANKGLVDLASKNVMGGNFKNVLDHKPILADLKSLRDVVLIARNDEYQRSVVLLLGSILASFDIHEYLFELSNAMKKGDCLIIGNAIRTGDRFANIENYKHPLFEEWFFHLVKEIGFSKEELEYNARFQNGRVECYYKVKKDKKVNHEGKEFEFKEGDEIIVAILYKYYSDELEKYCKMYFRDVDLIKDSDEEQALVCCIK